LLLAAVTWRWLQHYLQMRKAIVDIVHHTRLIRK
jgi:hypothetical protein